MDSHSMVSCEHCEILGEGREYNLKPEFIRLYAFIHSADNRHTVTVSAVDCEYTIQNGKMTRYVQY